MRLIDVEFVSSHFVKTRRLVASRIVSWNAIDTRAPFFYSTNGLYFFGAPWRWRTQHTIKSETRLRVIFNASDKALRLNDQSKKNDSESANRMSSLHEDNPEQNFMTGFIVILS